MEKPNNKNSVTQKNSALKTVHVTIQIHLQSILIETEKGKTIVIPNEQH